MCSDLGMDYQSASPAAQEQVIQDKLVQCGLASRGIRVAYSDDLQGYEIIITPEAGAKPELFPCIREVAERDIVRFTDPEMYHRYLGFVDELLRPLALKTAEEELAKLGRLKGFPSRTAFESDGLFAAALEVHCGLKPGTAIRPVGGSLAFEPPKEDLGDAKKFIKKYSCLLAALSFVGAKGEMKVGFIGNAAVAQPD